ncbi:hypothetical protein XELAEV_18000011mg [Xenopus laevis]|uniref:Uncharacterized protein n=1 Tax=Xenopus laevis TaxID=8355 RepID=A0A974BQN5_XENLA|nr:hypothetical protein XELAEV_18000011mg [Xenopus laevis]
MKDSSTFSFGHTVRSVEIFCNSGIHILVFQSGTLSFLLCRLQFFRVTEKEYNGCRKLYVLSTQKGKFTKGRSD